MAGYLLVWTIFSLVASSIQFGLHRTALMSADMRISSAVVSGLILVIVGVYQWLPIKERLSLDSRAEQ